MRYITIEREYGSGGTKIAAELAKQCHIPCYGKEILEAAAAKMNVPIDMIRVYEEKTTNSLLYSLYLLNQIRSGSSDNLLEEGKVFLEEQKIIQEFARKGSAVFLGHCATEALESLGDVIKVFIHADEKTKRQRILEDYQIPEVEITSIERRNNRRRENYYVTNTGQKWMDFHNYDIVLDSSCLGIDGCVRLLKGLFETVEEI